jgi:hypothetical protein
MTRIEGTLHEYQFIFLTISRSVLLRMKNISGKSCRGIQNTHFVFSKFIFFENITVYEIMWKSMVQPDLLQMTIQYGACALRTG